MSRYDSKVEQPGDKEQEFGHATGLARHVPPSKGFQSGLLSCDEVAGRGTTRSMVRDPKHRHVGAPRLVGFADTYAAPGKGRRPPGTPIDKAVPDHHIRRGCWRRPLAGIVPMVKPAPHGAGCRFHGCILFEAIVARRAPMS